MAADVIVAVGTGAMIKLAIEAPKYALIKELVVEAHEVTLDVEFDGISGNGVVVGGLADVMREAFLAIERALGFAARIGVGQETSIPPVGGDVIEEMMDNTVAKRRGNDFTSDGIMHDKSDAAAGFIIMAYEAIAEGDEIFHGVKFEAMFVDSFLFAAASVEIGCPEFVEEKSFVGVIIHEDPWRILGDLVGVVWHIRARRYARFRRFFREYRKVRDDG